MQIVIIQNDLAAVRALPDGRVALLILIAPFLTKTYVRLAKAAADPKLTEDGELIIAESLPAAFGAL